MAKSRKLVKVERPAPPTVSVPTTRARSRTDFLRGVQGTGVRDTPRTTLTAPHRPAPAAPPAAATRPAVTGRTPVTTAVAHPVQRTRTTVTQATHPVGTVREPVTGMHPTERVRTNDVPTAVHPVSRTRPSATVPHPATRTTPVPLTTSGVRAAVVREPVRAVHPVGRATPPKEVVAAGVGEPRVATPAIRATFPGTRNATNPVTSLPQAVQVPIGSVRPVVRAGPLRLSEL